MLYVAGTADPFVPYQGGEMNNNVTPIVAVDSAVQFWVRHNGCQAASGPVALPDLVRDDHSTVVRYDFTDCDCGAEVRLFKVLGGGHTWPGVELTAQAPVLGETNEDIRASFELWDFFSAHRRCSQATAGAPANAAPRCAIFPHPAQAWLHVRADRPIHSLRVVDLMGRTRTRRQGTTHGREARVDVRALPKGWYLLWVQRQGAAPAVRRFRKGE